MLFWKSIQLSFERNRRGKGVIFQGNLLFSHCSKYVSIFPFRFSLVSASRLGFGMRFCARAQHSAPLLLLRLRGFLRTVTSSALCALVCI